MAFGQFADIQDFLILETGTKHRIAEATIPANTELKHIKLTLFKFGALAGSEQIRLRLHSTDRYESPFAISDWANLSDIASIPANYLGSLRFDFDRVNLDLDNEIFIEVETNNYTRNGETFYLGLGLDIPVSYNSFNVANGAPVAVQIIGYR